MPNNQPAQITIPLDIPDVDVMDIQTDAEGRLTLTVTTRDNTAVCGVCNKIIECNHGCGKPVTLRHLPILGRETYICLHPKRAKCPHCLYSPTTTQTVTWYHQRSPHTQAYDEYLMRQLRGSTVADVSLKERVGYDAIIGTLERQVPNEVNWDTIKRLDSVGVDEIATRKGHKGYRAVITARQDDGQLHVLAVLPDRKKRR